MKPLKVMEVLQFVEANIGTFHQKRVARLNKLELKTILRKKNPYLFRAKHLSGADQIVRGLADAFVSSNEETIFGDWLEGLAIFINNKVYDGRKSGIKGIDLEFEKDSVRYIVAIKSGPNWGNSSQIEKMLIDFKSAARTLRTSQSGLQVIAVNGCCYGKEHTPDKGDYFKYCGQRFWEFISGDEDLYTTIITPLGYQAKERNEEFMRSYTRMINGFIREFMNDFCDVNDEIDWDKLVQFNSGSDQ